MATTAQRLAKLEADVVALKTADVALGARIDKEVAARVAGDTSLANRIAALEAKAHTHDEPAPVPPPDPTPIPPPVIPPPYAPLQEPHTPTGAPPAGWASGSLTLQQAIDQAQTGAILNLGGRGIVSGPVAKVTKPLTLVGYGTTLTNPAQDPVLVAMANDVTIEGFAGRDMGIGAGQTPAQISGRLFGAFQVGGYGALAHRATLRNLDLANAVLRVSDIQGGNGHRFLGLDIGRSGQTGFDGSGTEGYAEGGSDWYFARCRFRDANTANYDPGDTAAPIKLLFLRNLVVEDCEIADNPRSRGFWTDTGVDGFVVRRVRSHDNKLGGFFLEAARNGIVEDCVSYHNSLTSWQWGYDAGFTAVSAENVEFRRCISAWNGGGGFSFLSTDRTDDGPHTGCSVHDCVVAMSSGERAIAFLENGGVGLLDGTNRGANNAVYGSTRYAFGPDMTLAQFNATPGGGGSTRTITRAELDAILTAAGVPLL